MNSILNFIIQKMGMDKAIAYSSGARFIQAFTGLASIFFIAKFLSGEEQGYYYTFSSILAVQVFFELGLTGIITQYVAHEAVYLKLNDDFSYDGPEKYKSRLSSLLRFCVKWYTVISLFMFLVLILVGFIFFDKYQKDQTVEWKIPWLILVASTSIKLFQSPMSSFLMGLGKIKEVNKVTFYQQIIMPLSMWIGLLLGFKLYIVGVSSFLSVLVWNIYVKRSNLWYILVNLWKQRIDERISYMKEIFPMQWRIGISWISGFFIFQLMNPVLFATEGAIVAGQLGMTMAVLSGIQSLSMSWMNTKIPLYSGYIQERKYDVLDSSFSITLRQMMSVCCVCIIIMSLGIYSLKLLHVSFGSTPLSDRFLPFGAMLIMQVTIIFNMLTYSWATYLRCHKKEPFMFQSFTMGVLCMLSTLLLGNYFGLYGVVGGYGFLIAFIGTPWGYLIYKTKKKDWHGSN